MSKRKNDDRIVIYTDGACEPNPGPGAWGALLLIPGNPNIELSGFEARSTNQRMELMAPIVALESMDKGRALTVVSDSQYVIKGITSWINTWKRNGWRNAKKKPVANRELWERLDKACVGHRQTLCWQWVRGHDGDPGNERADHLARARLFAEIKDDPRAYREAIRGFSRHGDFDPTPYLESGYHHQGRGT